MIPGARLVGSIPTQCSGACAVGEEMQQRCSFRSDKGFEARADVGLGHVHAAAAAGAAAWGSSASDNFKEEGLTVRLKVIQAGAALWMPAQQGCNWPVNIMLEVGILLRNAYCPMPLPVTVINKSL